jgi:predicted aminopeptidase
VKCAWIALLLAPLLAGCETMGYYSQAIRGHLDVLAAARPIDAWLADPATPEALRARLEVARAIRRFASRELGLPDNAVYTSYAELGRRYAVWNVFAAPEFSLEPRRECFAFAGCVSYRGFFAEAEARAHAERLRGEGFDVFVAGVPAYSTLGWSADPLLSTFIHDRDAQLARLVFHELAHQVVYARDDTAFNESFAVAVEEEGVRRWLESIGNRVELQAFREAQARRGELAALIGAARERLAALYRERLEAADMRARKRAGYARLQAEYQTLKQRWGGFAGYDFLIGAHTNNALLASFAVYTQHVPAFRRLLEEERGELARFYERVGELAALPREARTGALQALGAGERAQAR